MVANTIPYTAWEQAVFVALFILMVIGLLYWFSRQQAQWQRFIETRDQQWQGFLRDQRNDDQETIRALIGEVRSLAAQLVALRGDFNEHNTWERAKLDEMQKPAAPPRRAK